jgi:hypothetical protein
VGVGVGGRKPAAIRPTPAPSEFLSGFRKSPSRRPGNKVSLFPRLLAVPAADRATTKDPPRRQTARVLPPRSLNTRSDSSPGKPCGLAPGRNGKNRETDRKPLSVQGLNFAAPPGTEFG